MENFMTFSKPYSQLVVEANLKKKKKKSLYLRSSTIFPQFMRILEIICMLLIIYILNTLYNMSIRLYNREIQYNING